MSAWKKHRAQRREVDLGGERSTPPRVDRLLESARAPGTSRELASEDVAAAHFHRAHLERVRTTREAAPSKRSPRAGLKAALASAGVVALMSTGAAFAASGHAPWSAAASAHPTTLPSHSHPTDNSSESGDPSESTDTSGPHSGGTSGPDAHAYPGLCRAYAAGQKNEHGDALSSPPFAALVTAAGGPDAVSGFCASLAPTPNHPTHPVKPSHPVKPNHPTHPSHPAHPSHSADPTSTHTHPTHPTHPSGTSHPSGPTTHHSPGSHPSRP